MNRQSVLVWLLVVVALIGLPIHYMDAAMAENRERLEDEQVKLQPLRRQATAVRDREEKVAARTAKVAEVKNRLIAAQPFATIQSELSAASTKTGVTLGSLILEGPATVAELPDVVRYQATLQVTGNRTQYLDFLKELENHRLLIELPEASLRMAPAAKGALPQVQQVLTLGFYAVAVKK